MENFIVFLIIGLAAVYTVRMFYKSAKSENSCGGGCSCSGCDACPIVEEKQENDLRS